MKHFVAAIGVAIAVGGAVALGGTIPARAAEFGTVVGVPDVYVEFGGRHYHGPRYRYRRHGFTHFHEGYWYPRAWWADPVVVPRHGSAHIEWCGARFRSYDPSSNTYRGYDGRDHRCHSPYS